MQLNTATIISTATEILSEYGLADLTMRRLARALDVAPGALYWHFPSKQQLLGAIANQQLGSVHQPDFGVATAKELTQYCVDIYCALTSLRDGAEITLAALASSTIAWDFQRDLKLAAGERGIMAYYCILGAALDVQARQNVARALGHTPLPEPEPHTIEHAVDTILNHCG